MAEIKKQSDFLVVQELPQAPMRTVLGDDGKTYELITFSEALKEILELLREIRKVIG